MTAAMAALGFGSDQVAGDGLAFQSLFFIGFLLFVLTLLLNLLVTAWYAECERSTDMSLATPDRFGARSANEVTVRLTSSSRDVKVVRSSGPCCRRF